MATKTADFADTVPGEGRAALQHEPETEPQASKNEKMLVSLLTAILAPWAIALAVDLLINSPVFSLILGLALMFWTLIGGFQKNGELEESVGGFLGKMTNYVIPPGVSWWIPAPFGQALQKITTAKQTLLRSVQSGKPFPDVKTRDGGTVEVGIVVTWHVSDARKAANFGDIDKVREQVDALQDRGVRYFALYFDSDEDIDGGQHGESALSHKKKEFSSYLKGAMGIPDLDGKEILNDTTAKANAIGITIDNVDVVDVNEPAEVRKARNEAAAEIAQGEQERRDVSSIRSRILELMWGPRKTEEEIDRMINAGKKPLMTQEEATRTVRAARKDLLDVNVSGDGGDFTKAEALRRAFDKPMKGNR